MKVGLALGSNVGDRLKHLQQAKAYLLSLSNEGWHVASPLYETEPLGCPPNSPKFLNAVLEIEFGGAPKMLLKKLQAYEVAHGRDRDLPKNAARTIDIDILYFGKRKSSRRIWWCHIRGWRSGGLCYWPLSTIQPDMIVKGSAKTVRMLLRELRAGEGDVRFVQHDW